MENYYDANSSVIGRRDFLKWTGMATTGLAISGSVEAFGQTTVKTAVQRPNIIFILIDDMGYNGVSCFGNKYVETPNIDRLGTEGMSFTDAYAMPVCSPTRAAFLSGQYCARTKLTKVINNRFWPKARLITPKAIKKLPKDTYTIAKMMTDAGYRTGISGKWYVGGTYATKTAKNKWGDEYFERYGFDFSGDANESKKEPDKAVMGITEDIIGFIDENQGRPFFAYLSHFTVHTPLKAPKYLIDKYIKLGYGKSASPWGITQERPTADYLAMIEHLDNSVGKFACQT